MRSFNNPSKLILVLALILFSFSNAFAQPANDNPCSATNLGTLPTPGACVGGLQNGAPVTLNNQSTVGATGPNPYVYLTGCSGGGNMQAPALDTWYQFTASGTIANIVITGFPNASVGFWNGTCSNLGGLACYNVPGSGNGSFTVTQITVGQTYWVQISGGTTTATDANFSIAIDNDIDCNNCLQGSSLTANPAPVNGGYQPGQQVQFCFTVSSWTEVNTNWFHGVQITMGSGWTGTITNPIPAADCSYDPTPGPGNAGAGTWGFYNSVTSSATGATFGQGFYFDNANVAGSNPGQNFGDPTNGNCTWTFCWTLTVSPGCTPGSNLGVTVNTSGDGESGSWSSIGCAGDNATNFLATVICCSPPTLTQTNVLCNGASTGSATATPGSGASPWDFVWTNAGGTVLQTNNNVATSTINGLPAGTYTVTVTDNAGCVTTGSVTITQPTAITSSTSQVNVLCNGNSTGSITVTANGGTPPYNVSWTGTTSGNPAGTEIVASGGSYTLNSLLAGTYNITITDANGCTRIVPVVTITQPGVLAGTGTPTAVSCFGGNNGSILVNASGGIAGYNVSWTGPSSGNPAGTEIAVSGGNYSITGLVSGNYTVTITDANGCIRTIPVTVNPGVIIDANITPVAAQCLIGNSFNFSGSTSTISSGTITSYTWVWGDATANGSGVNATHTYAAAGTYTVTLTVSNGVCTNSETFNVTVNPNPTVTITATNPLCNGGTGSLTANPVGSAPFTYSWTSGLGTTQTVNNVPVGGPYTVTVNNSFGCPATASASITQPTAIVASTTQVNVLCNGASTGSITVTASGGNAGYNISWTGTTSGNPAGTEIAASGGTYTLTGLPAGTYNITVTDANGCVRTIPVVTITQPAAIVTSTTQVNVLCNATSTGSITLTASGGTAGYNISWTGTTSGNPVGTEIAASGGTYTLTGLPSGNYNITVTDANGCTSVVPVVTITQPTAIVASTTQVNVLCNGASTGSITVTASAGTAGYNISWTGTTSGNPAGTEIAASGGTYTISGLPAGNYNITVTDANGCIRTIPVVTITQPAVLNGSTTQTNVSCNGGTNGSISVTATSGTAPYNVSWTGVSSGNPAGTEIAASGGSYTIPNLASGNYTVTITDANGCTLVLPVVTITQPALLTATTTSTATGCGTATGTATATPGGGTGPYTYSWNSLPVQTTQTATNLAGGSYTVTVTDAAGCTVTSSVGVSGATGPTISENMASHVNVSCNGGNNGSAAVTASGGVAPLTYSWSPSGGTGTSASGLTAGVYTVTVTDANLCTASVPITITQPAVLVPTASVVTNVSCNGGSNGSGTVSVSGGTSPYTYAWFSGVFPAGTALGQTTLNSTGLSAGNYYVVVTDANGCAVSSAITITQPNALSSTSTFVPVACNGGNTGSINVTISNGVAPYSYAWTGPGAFSSSNEDPTGLLAGTYNLTVTDANLCTYNTSVNVTEPPLLTVSTSVVNAFCGQSNGSATATGSGGTGAITYSWNTSPVQTTATAANLPAGTYTVTATDANGCTANANATINNLSGPTSSATATNVSCNGGTNGTATVNVVGGTAPISISWNTTPIQTTATATNLPAGSYTATVTDASGCVTTSTVAVTQPSALTGSTSFTPVLCNGGSTGTATVSVSGGTPGAGYSYSWNSTPVQNLQTASGLPAGTYTATVTDANGCIFTANATVTQPTAVVITSATPTPASCFNVCDGSVNSSASGGTAPLSYTWTGGLNGANQTGLCDGNYTLVVTDANGCSANTTIAVTEPTQLTVSTSVTNANCGNSDGSATATPSGGTAPYSFSWSSGSVTNTQSNVPASTITVTVTDANGCTATANAVIGNNAAGTLSTTVINNVSCFAASNGQINGNLVGGAAPFTYSWNTSPVQTTINATNLGPGSYTLTVTDANGCVLTSSSTITQPPLLTISTTPTAVSCPGGTNGAATSIPNGGTAPYSFSWSNSANTQNISGLTVGSYTVVVTDANGCTANSTAAVNEPNPFVVNITTQDVTCKNGCSGQATVSVTGGTGSYNYVWSDALTQITPTAVMLCAGNYTVNITDANNCPASGSTTINEPTLMVLTTNGIVDAHCQQNDGAGCVSASGGVSPYTFNWLSTGNTAACDNALFGGSYLVEVTDANNCVDTATVQVNDISGPTATIIAQVNVSCNGGNNGSATVDMIGGTGIFTVQWDANAGSQTTPTASNLSAGTYSVTITDAAGCTASTTVTISEPTTITYIPNTVHPSCFSYCDGIAWVGVSGGTPAYTFDWRDGANTPLGVNNDSLTNLCAGNYILILSDANGCQQIINYTLTDPPQVAGNISSTNNSCFNSCDGTATIVPTVGFTNFTYSWNSSPIQITATATGLCAGNYTVILTDSHGCFNSFNTTVTEPPLLNAVIDLSGNVNCFSACNGFAQVTISGGTGPYQVSWSNGSISQVNSNLCAGTYIVTVTDANGCTATDTVVITEPSQLIANSIGSDVTCYNACNGSADLTVSGGVTPYTYQWDNPAFSTTQDVNGLCNGTFNVVVTDFNGCTVNNSVVINQPTILTFTINKIDANCGQNNGSICANVVGGVAPYIYSWNNGANTACNQNIVAGCYTLTVTDGNGCTKDSLICINDIAGPTASVVSFSNVTCAGFSNGAIIWNSTGGVSPYTYNWVDGAGNPIASLNGQLSSSTLSGGTYGFIVTDSAGCVSTLTQFIFEPNGMNAAITNTTMPLCFGGCDGSATVSVSGGVTPYSYNWTGGATPNSNLNTGLCAGNYPVTISDANNCTFTVSATINQPTLLAASQNTLTNVTCFGFCNGTLSVTTSGATPPYSYSWTNNVSTGTSASNLCPNNYVVNITDANGCTAVVNGTITEPSQLTVSLVDNDATCSLCNGTSVATAGGGTSPYSYSWSSGNTPNTGANSGLCAGQYNVNVTDNNGCVITGTATINNQAGPSITSMTMTPPSCFGLNNGTATVNYSGGTNPIAFAWDDPSSQNTQTATALTSGNYCVVVSDNNNCTATNCINVTQPNPLTAIGDLDATICYGDSTQLWASGAGGTLPYTINWSTPGLNGTGPIMVYPLASTTYCFTVTDANGCLSPQDCIAITVNPPLSMTVSATTSICLNETVDLTANASGGNGGPYSFTWTDAAGNPVTDIETGNTSTATVSPNQTTWYYVTLSDGCSISILDSTQVILNASPIIFLNAVDSSGCAPFTAQFIMNSDIGVTYTYDYQCDGIIDYNGANANSTFTYLNPGTYDVCVTATSANGCVSTLNAPGIITVYPVPTADFTINPTSATILAPTITFSNTSLGSPTVFNWDFGDGYTLTGNAGANVPPGTHGGATTGTIEIPVHNYADSGTYAVTLIITNQYGCTSTVTYNVTILPDFAIYVPNAFTPNGDGNNDFFIPIGVGIDPDNFEFMIFNRWGELIFESSSINKPWDGTYKGRMSQQDVYVWKLKAFDYKGNLHEHIGHVTLLK